MSRDRRQDIINAAIDLFAKHGFRGTTTRDLAQLAGVNEAIIFRHFKTKSDLYSAILDRKACEQRNSVRATVDELMVSRDDEALFRAIARTILIQHSADTTFLRLLLFSALEGHELAEMFLAGMSKDTPITNYIQMRIDEGAFRAVNPSLAATAFINMLFGHVQRQELFGERNTRHHELDLVVETIVSIFLKGIRQ